MHPLVEGPEVWPISVDDSRARRYLLSRFPYSIVNVVAVDGGITVAAVAHTKRKPGYWLRPRLSGLRGVRAQHLFLVHESASGLTSIGECDTLASSVPGFARQLRRERIREGVGVRPQWNLQK